MDALSILGSTAGLGFLSGFRLYFTVAALGLAVRFNLFSLGKEMTALNALADPRVIAIAAVLGTIEFLADKIPWIDSVWDSVHTVVRPLAAGALAITALGDMDPFLKAVLGLLSGSIALGAHSAKAATRLAVNHSPEPFSNVALSVAEDIAAPVGLWVVTQYPVVALGVVGFFLLVFALVAPWMFRLMRMEFAALRGVLRSWFGGTATGSVLEMPSAVAANSGVRDVWRRVADSLEEVPGGVREAVPGGSAMGLYCAATSSVDGLTRSTGWLVFGETGIVFVTRRMFTRRTRVMAAREIRGGRWKERLFLDELVIETAGGELVFDVFKTGGAAGRVVQEPRLV